LKIPAWKLLILCRQANECPKPVVSHVVTAEEKQLLKATTFTVATEMNKNENWVPHELCKLYKGAAIQTFKHHHYDDKKVYRCQGPYHKDWGVGTVSWHPSVIGHQLRADHHTYFWLSVWRDAIADILQTIATKESATPETMLRETRKHLDSMLHAHRMPSTIKYQSNISDSMRCFTNYEPKHDRSASINEHVVSGLKKENSGKGWEDTVLEALNSNWKEGILKKHVASGYLDYKNILVADPDAGPLSIKMTIRKNAPFFICEPTMFMGKMIASTDHFWLLKPLVYVTENVADTTSFVFAASSAKRMSYTHVTSTGGGQGEICVQTDAGVPPGSHVLTIVPTHKEKKLMLATLMFP